ncbi:Mitotic spindle checkpoint component mad2 [Borealophlyctis nickersoniae]|nr:Mitotic spindle checkpoint component mad2 [Borealophlyctis nickersoniae]
MATVQTRKQITLRGSAQMVVEFFEHSINSILFQRGLYPPEDFKMVKKYGLNLLVTNDDSVQAYLKQILVQLDHWIMAKAISKLVMVISSKDTREVLERWQFNIQLEKGQGNENERDGRASNAPPKTEKDIHAEISAIMRQITASVSFLPMLSDPCTFNILAYTDKDAEVPATWVESDPKLIKNNAEQVRLRSFSTSVHKVDALVAYRLADD